jgi:hypothetical protein
MAVLPDKLQPSFNQAPTPSDSRRCVKRLTNEKGVRPAAPVQLFYAGVQEILEGHMDRVAPFRPPGSAFLLSQNRSMSNLSLARAEPMNVDVKNGRHTR